MINSSDAQFWLKPNRFNKPSYNGLKPIAFEENLIVAIEEDQTVAIEENQTVAIEEDQIIK